MALLLSDEQYPFPVVEALRRLGHDVVTVKDRGRDNQGFPDPGVLALATAEGRAVLTGNRRDFIRLHRQTPQHAGIIVCTDDRDYPALAARVDAAVMAAGDLRGRLIRVNRPPR
ncbi:MAG: DUF5615 family PIN-like protein [Gemmataceae bacterium]|nr:DUF5615 family PIN-like protein [Gemmataceae bacterium]